MKDSSLNIKSKLSILWILVMFNMIFADIFSIIIELVDKDTLDIPGDVKVVMAIATVLTNVPIFMIYLSKVLSYKWNRRINITAAIFTIIYIIGGGSLLLHYFIIASVEVFLLLLIILISFRWEKT